MSAVYESCAGCGAETPSERCFGCFHDFGPGLTAPSNANTSVLAPTDALRLVPLEPTWDQLVAMRDCCAELSGIEADSETMLTALYRAALKAAPASPLPGGEQLSKNIGELKSPDLDALEKRLIRTKWTRERDDGPNGNYFDEACDEDDYGAEESLINPDGPAAVATIKALIAELKEAREALIAVKVSADHMPPMSSTRRIEWRIKSFNPAIALVRAFLARNGKGEG